MTSKKQQLILANFPSWGGAHRAAWRMPNADVDPENMFESHRRWIELCERGKFHIYFVADRVAIAGGSNPALACAMPDNLTLDPYPLIAALSQHTKHIGLLITSSTTYDRPYYTARRLGSIDHISQGRLAWNVVTSGVMDDAPNFGLDKVDHDTRYEQAEEFVDAVFGLWDSFDDDAFVIDRTKGRYFDPQRVHVLNFDGKFIKSRGPLNVARPPQGHPVIAQAGASAPGKALAARVADIVFGIGSTIEAARQGREELRAAVAERGRDADQVKYLTELILLIGRTEEEVDAKVKELDDLVDVEAMLPDVSRYMGVDLSAHPLDGPVPEPPLTDGGRGVQRTMLERARSENLTIRQLIQVHTRSGGAARLLTATPVQVADFMESWFEAGAVDGFVLRFADPEDSMVQFVESVVPELQRRGLYHEEYEDGTLRDQLGMARPRDRSDRS